MARKPECGKRDHIITAGITTFAQKGYTGTRIADVAEAAGIGKGTIYEYFRSKEALFYATFEHLMSGTVDQMNDIAQKTTGSPSNRLRTMADTVIRTWLANLDLYGLVLEFWSATTALPGRRRFKAAFQSGYSQCRQVVAALIQEGVDHGEFRSEVNPRMIASALIGSWDALLLQAWLDPEFDPVHASQNHMQVIVAGLRKHPFIEDSI
jgi:AcrR family transcriptional regulator